MSHRFPYDVPGSFGSEKEHYGVSQAVAELNLFPAIRRAPKSVLIVADGFSCRTQIEEGTGRQERHCDSRVPENVTR